MLARRQLEQGACLSQRTFRLLQTTQLRSFLFLPEVSNLACFSAPETEARGLWSVAGTPCDMFLDALARVRYLLPSVSYALDKTDKSPHVAQRSRIFDEVTIRMGDSGDDNQREGGFSASQLRSRSKC